MFQGRQDRRVKLLYLTRRLTSHSAFLLDSRRVQKTQSQSETDIDVKVLEKSLDVARSCAWISSPMTGVNRRDNMTMEHGVYFR